MNNIREIKKQLQQEDYKNLSLMTGYSVDYIQDCIFYRRNNLLIVQAAHRVLHQAAQVA